MEDLAIEGLGVTTQELVPVLGARSLEELATVANAENAACAESLLTALGHALRAGEALEEAWERVPRGEWMRWLEANFDGSVTLAAHYRRFAANKDLLQSNGVTHIDEARRFLQSLGVTLRQKAGTIHRDEARRLRAQGFTAKQIALMLSMSEGNVYHLLNPQSSLRSQARRRARDRNSRKALERETRARAVRSIGGDIGKVAEHLVKAAQAAQRCLEIEGNSEAKVRLNDLMMRVYEAEDQLAAAIGITHPDLRKNLFAGGLQRGTGSHASRSPRAQLATSSA